MRARSCCLGAMAAAVGDTNGSANTRRRVKLYLLNDDGQWDDRGTGHISCQYNQDLQGFGLFLRSEADNEELLGQRIVSEDIYQHQNETIITWTDPASNADYALSFQENEGCNEMWEQILNVQGRQSDGSGPGQAGPAEVDPMQLLEIELPEVTADNLEKISELVTECTTGPPQRREALSMRLVVGAEGDRPVVHEAGQGMAAAEAEAAAAAAAVAAASGAAAAAAAAGAGTGEAAATATVAEKPAEESSDSAAAAEEELGGGRAYVMQLIGVFHECELTENEEHLAALYRIFKGILFLNDPPIIEMLLGQDIVMDVMGILETDPDLHASQRTSHREVLKHGEGLFKEVVQIKDSAIRDKIRQTILLGYLKDTVLPRTIEDSTLNTLSTMIYFNQVEIVNTLHQDAEYVAALFAKMEDPMAEGYSDAVRLLQELCNMAKHLQAQPKTVFYQVIIDAGLFKILEGILTHDDATLRAGSTDMMHLIVMHDPSLLRQHLLSQNPRVFFHTLVDRMAHDPVEGVQGQLVELIRTLIDVETMPETADEKDAFLDEFYLIFMALVDASWPRENGAGEAMGGCAGSPRFPLGSASGNSSAVSATAKTSILDLLSYCAQHHSYRIRYCILSNSIIQRVTAVLRESRVSQGGGVIPILACIGFFRVIVGTQDEFYLRYLVKNSLFKPIVELLISNGSRYNLLNSALLELFEFIRTENIKTLIVHLVEKFRATFEGITYVQTFKGLILKYEQANDQSFQDGRDPGGGGGGGGDGSGGVGVGGANGGSGHGPRGPPSVAVGGMIGGAGRGLDRSEEDYFNEDSDDEDDEDSGHLLEQRQQQQQHSGAAGGSAAPSPNALNDLAGAYGAGSDEEQDDDSDSAATPAAATAKRQRDSDSDSSGGDGERAEVSAGGVSGDERHGAAEGGSSKKLKPDPGEHL